MTGHHKWSDLKHKPSEIDEAATTIRKVLPTLGNDICPCPDCYHARSLSDALDVLVAAAENNKHLERPDVQTPFDAEWLESD